MREKFLLSRLLVTSVTLISATFSTPVSVDITPTLQHHQRNYSTTRNTTASPETLQLVFYYSKIVEIKRPLFYFNLYLIFFLCLFKEETWWWRKSAVICAVSSSTRFETTKLNSDHDKFCLDRSLSNFSKALLGNNTFAVETLFFFSKMLSNTDWKTSNLSQ